MTSKEFQLEQSFSCDGNSFDYVVDFPPSRLGSRRMYTVRYNSCRCNLGLPYGLSYIFVQGKDSTCLVTCDISVTWNDARMPFYNLESISMSLADIRFRASQFEKCYLGEKHGDLDPFAMVSVLLGPDDVSAILPPDKEIGFEYDEGSSDAINLLKESSTSFEESAVNFLREKLKNNTPFTLVETIQTAISALQYLYGKNFQANEIKVFVVGELGKFKSLLPVEEVVQHLAVINKI